MDLRELEAFALAEDRSAHIDQLIAGSDDFYYYKSLVHQQRDELDEVDKVVDQWAERHEHSSRLEQIRDRQMLLRCDSPDRESIRQDLGLHFDHERIEEGRVTNHPTKLDPVTCLASLRADAAKHPRLQRYTDRALLAMLDADLRADDRRTVLERLRRPDHPAIVGLVLADLRNKKTSGFGSVQLHGLLLLSQLQALAAKEPALLREPAFVQTWLTRLRPSADVDVERDPVARRAWLLRLWAFVSELGGSFNSLKAHVLYHLLDLDRTEGRLERSLLMTYLELPRKSSYVAVVLLKSVRGRNEVANLREDFSAYTGLSAVFDDEALVAELLGQVFVSESGYDAYAHAVRKDWLRRLFATTKILAGVGDRERWYSELDDPAAYQDLKERVDIELSATNRSWYRATDPVELVVDIKNVETLVIKVFEINTFNYLSANGVEVDTGIDLDGLVASHEETHHFAEPPLERVRRTFSLDGLDRPGVFVVELIGGTKSSRALIRKGNLRLRERTGAAGHVLKVYDGEDAHLKGATVWLEGREFRPNDRGEVLLPFGSQTQTRAVLLRHGNLATLAHVNQRGGRFQFTAGLYVDRESLLRRETAEVLIRPLLRIDGRPVSLELLEDVVLTIESTDRHGVSSSAEVADFALNHREEVTHSFRVPDDLAGLTVSLRARYKRPSVGDKQDVAASRTWNVNDIDLTDQTEDVFLSRTADGFVLHVLGKTGEARADRPLSLSLGHRDFTNTVRIQLQANAEGRIVLGDLDGFKSVRAELPGGGHRSWPLGADGCTLPTRVHAEATEPVSIPYMGEATAVSRDAFSLLERRGTGFLADCADHLALVDGYLECRDLTPGDYSLYLEETGQHIDIAVSGGAGTRWLETTKHKPLQIVSVQPGEELLIRVAGGVGNTRVHVLATHFEPEHSVSAQLQSSLRTPGAMTLTWAQSQYLSGRDIGDEYRYVLDRRYAKKYPGNMLGRPGLLLNPWAMRDTQTEVLEAAGGEAYAAMAPPPAPAARSRARRAKERSVSRVESQPNLDFLSQPAVVLTNLRPDADGLVRVQREALGPHTHLRIVAVDTANTVWRHVAIPAAGAPYRDLRLGETLAAGEHFTEQKQISVVTGGETLEIVDITTSELEVYDSLSRVYRLYQTLSGDTNLSAFAFVLRWPELTFEEKCTLYSENACHELSFFICCKDPELFEAVVKPYLENKKHKTFLDRYLLGHDLGDFLRPWAHGNLNIVERILLGRHISDEWPAAKRHAADLHDLLARDVERENYLFQTAIKGSALDTDDALGIADIKKKEKRKGKKASDRPAAQPAGGLMGATSRGMAEPEPMECMDEEYEEEEDADLDFFMKEDASLMALASTLYREVPKTQELGENNYYKLTIEEQGPELVTVNAFWRDFAAADAAEPFLSKHLAQASGNFTEMMFALSVLDLPFEAEPPQTAWDDRRLSLTSRGHLIAFHQEIKPAELTSGTVPILVNQNTSRADDRYRHEGGERLEKYVSGELSVHTVYVSQIVLTNPSSAHQKLDLLMQIPQGALPVVNGFETRGRHVHLSPYGTESLEFSFYFPHPGTFHQCGVQVAANEALVAAAPAMSFAVVSRPTSVDRDSWAWVSQHGEDDDVMGFLRDNNADRLDLGQIAWRMKDRSFYDGVISLLSERHIYHETLWAYALLHGDTAGLSEVLHHDEELLDRCGLWLETPLLRSDPVVRGRYQHLEYAPLVNARAHALGGQLRIANDRLEQQYTQFLTLLTFKRALGSDDWLSLAYYLFLQDRVDDGLEALAKVDADAVETRLQLDYLRCYAAFYTDPEQAREIADEHLKYPVDRWRKLFGHVVAQLDEAGVSAARDAVDPDDRDQAQERLAAAAPALSVEVAKGRVALRYDNIVSCRVNYYEMDIELLFSRQPFVQQQAGQFSFIAPNHTEMHELPSGGRHELPLPERYRGSNVVVEVVGGGIEQAQAHYAHLLRVQLTEAWGHVSVCHDESGAPLPRVYVKVYGRFSDGSVRFYKDGYTDLRGRFDYASLSSDELGGVERFAILVLSKEDGAVIREAAPPTR